MRRFSPVFAAILAASILATAVTGGVRGEDKQPAPAPSLLQRLPPDAVTHHKLKLGSQEIAYTATAGTLPLNDDKGDAQGGIFYIAFTRDGVADAGQRPVTYAFNGGPGAASAYLDIGALGPRALDFGSSGRPQGASDRVGDNPDTWLPFTDLVFLDPVGTGYSRAVNQDAAKKFWNVRGDLDALAQVIRLHLTRTGRLTSPVYLAGESYGGFRAARLAQLLPSEQGIAPLGVMMISPVIEFRLMSGDEFDVLPWALRLPSYAAVALESKAAVTPDALKEAEHFALTGYLTALASPLDDGSASQQFYGEVAGLLGLDEATVARWRGRVPVGVYVKEMGRHEGQLLSRYDGSVGTTDPDPSNDEASDDPILQGSIAPFTRAFMAYARAELGYNTDLGYELLNGDVGRHWEWRDGEHGNRGSLGSADALRRALALHPRMHVLIAHGMTDLTTPYMMSRYVIDHLPSKLTAGRIELKLYPGGHMMYMRTHSRHLLHDDAQAFYGAEAP